MKKMLLFVSSLVLSILVTSCAQNVSPNTYQASEVGVTSKVVAGVVIAKRPVNIDANSGAGGLAGATAGASAGSTVGGDAASSIVGAVGGAVVGGVIGNAADKAVNHHQGFEYIIKLKNNSIISVVQAQDMQFMVKQHVLVIYGAMTRIIPDNTK
jgi:outer membrane lipoprotein SlyB